MFTATKIQAASYLFGVCLFSISFLVFLNSSVSFVVTDLLQQDHGVGNAVGTLGFADELVALVACPAWGVISDRIGVRAVCVLGYTIIGLALFLFVQAHNVFPQLLLARLFFSIGGAASSTMVTAILPSMITSRNVDGSPPPIRTETPTNGHTISPSISSELTITQTRHHQKLARRASHRASSPKAQAPTRLAGFVGLFTGFGALLALVCFLPLPAVFRGRGVDAGSAIVYTYYIVGVAAFAVAVIVFFGLRNLAGEEGKGFVNLIRAKDSRTNDPGAARDLSYVGLLLTAIKLGFKSTTLALGYLGGFVARASSVGISLFIPLAVNAWFLSSGLCGKSPDTAVTAGKPNRDQCHRAYLVAAELTGVSQLIALIFAPVFGYLADRYPRFNVPLLLAALIGIGGYSAFANLDHLDPKVNPWIFLIMALLGISQIGAIVCSLGLLGRSVLEADLALQTSDVETDASDPVPGPNPVIVNESQENTQNAQSIRQLEHEYNEVQETTGLLNSKSMRQNSHQHLKGSIAGVYSLAGGAGILILTKLGGYLFDKTSPSAPFYMLACFNGVLFVFGLLGCIWSLQSRR